MADRDADGDIIMATAEVGECYTTVTKSVSLNSWSRSCLSCLFRRTLHFSRVTIEDWLRQINSVAFLRPVRSNTGLAGAAIVHDVDYVPDGAGGPLIHCVVLSALAMYQVFQGHGHGTEIMNEIISWCRSVGVRRVLVNALDTAIGFYGRFGFKEVSKRQRMLNVHGRCQEMWYQIESPESCYPPHFHLNSVLETKPNARRISSGEMLSVLGSYCSEEIALTLSDILWFGYSDLRCLRTQARDTLSKLSKARNGPLVIYRSKGQPTTYRLNNPCAITDLLPSCPLRYSILSWLRLHPGQYFTIKELAMVLLRCWCRTMLPDEVEVFVGSLEGIGMWNETLTRCDRAVPKLVTEGFVVKRVSDRWREYRQGYQTQEYRAR